MRQNTQKGQSMVEFAIAVSALLVFLVGIPIIAKIANVNVLSIQALDYAAWRVREGNTDNDKLSSEINDRYFGETALIVDDEKIINTGARLGMGRDGQDIYEANSVRIDYTKDTNGNGLSVLSRGANLPINDKKGVVSITTPLQNLDVMPEIASNITINKSLYVDNQSLTALDGTDIQNHLKSMSSTMIPYNNGLQKAQNNVANSIISALNVIPIFSEHKIEDPYVPESTVPKDRMVKFAP